MFVAVVTTPNEIEVYGVFYSEDAASHFLDKIKDVLDETNDFTNIVPIQRPFNL